MSLLVVLAVLGGIFSLGALVVLGAIMFTYPVAYILDFKNGVKHLLGRIQEKRQARKDKKEADKAAKASVEKDIAEVKVEINETDVEVKEQA